MLFPMLLGRTALRGVFTVDPARSFLHRRGHARRARTWGTHRMKLAILSRNSKLYSTRRLVEAARERGHSVRVLDPLRCYMRISSDGFAMHYKGRPLAGYDAVIPRIGASITLYGTAVLRQFETDGHVSRPTRPTRSLRARDKLRCHQLLAAQGIGLPVDGVRRQPRRHRRPAGDARPAAARDQAQRRHAGRRA